MDKQLRYLVDRGMSIEQAYGQLGWTDALPAPGMRQCCYDVLRQKWLDENMEWQVSGWGYTCSAYHDCLERYVLAIRETNKAGRMKIAPGVYAPSPEEASCIKHRFAIYKDIARAYSECKALDILPSFPGAVETLNRLMLTDLVEKRRQPMYKMIQVAFNLAAQPPEHPPPHDTPEDDRKAEPNYWLYAAGAVGLILLTRR